MKLLNKDKLKIGWLTGVYRDTPVYPTLEDIEYEIIQWHLLECNKTLEEEIEFSLQWLIKKLNKSEEFVLIKIEEGIYKGIFSLTRTTSHKIYYTLINSSLITDEHTQ